VLEILDVKKGGSRRNGREGQGRAKKGKGTKVRSGGEAKEDMRNGSMRVRMGVRMVVVGGPLGPREIEGGEMNDSSRSESIESRL
jgi:hypothetical protein